MIAKKFAVLGKGGRLDRGALSGLAPAELDVFSDKVMEATKLSECE